MLKVMYFALGFALLLAGCTTPELAVDPKLQESAEIMSVQGRQGWLVNQKLYFGEFHTGKVDRSWKKGYDIPFILRFSGAKEKLSYNLYHSDGRSAEVFCLGKLKEIDMPLLNAYFEVGLRSKDNFTGTVVLSNGKTSYDFLVTNLNQNNWTKEASGFINSGNRQIKIAPIKTLANGQRMLAQHVPGFEFQMDGQTIGAVETLNQGRIWVRNQIDADMKMLVAAVSSALLLRSELERETV